MTIKVIVAVKGSSKSGNHGHGGRPGKIGGSMPKGTGSVAIAAPADDKKPVMAPKTIPKPAVEAPKGVPQPKPSDKDVNRFYAGDGPEVVYHVTTIDNIDGIIKKGLVPGAVDAPGQAWKAAHSSYATYLHGYKDAATTNRREMDVAGGGPSAATIVFKIPRNPKTAKSIVPDEDVNLNNDKGLQEYMNGSACAVIGGVPKSWIKSIILPSDSPMALQLSIVNAGIGVMFDQPKKKWRR